MKLNKVISPYDVPLYITIIFIQVTENQCSGTVKRPGPWRKERQDGVS